jgi:hypothetical protein
MAERACAFTGLKADSKMRFPQDDPHTWVEIPCSKHYTNVKMVPSKHVQLGKNEKYLAGYFIMTELANAGLLGAVTTANPNHEMARILIAENRMLVESFVAHLQKLRD